MTPEERFSALVEEFAGAPGVEVPQTSGPRRFGSDALKVDGSIFAMVVGGQLVVKLPRDRVDALVVDGTGAPFDGGKGRAMKEWVTVAVGDEETVVALAHEAMVFVRSQPRRR